MTLEDLTPREHEVAHHVAGGLTNKQIAMLLGIGQRRVRVLISAVAFKVGADAAKNERVQVANWYHAVSAVPQRTTA